MDSENRDYRFELLRFAKDCLWEDYQNRRQESDMNFDILRDGYNNNRLAQPPKYTVPATPQPEDIISMAEKFNKFILAKAK